MAAMIEPRKDDEMDPVASEVAGLGNRVSVLEVKVDVLDTKVDEGFQRVEGEVLEQRRELGAFRQEMNSRFDGMQRTMVIAAVAMPGAIAVLVRLIS